MPLGLITASGTTVTTCWLHDLITGAEADDTRAKNELWTWRRRFGVEQLGAGRDNTDGEFSPRSGTEPRARSSSSEYQKFLAENSHRGHADRTSTTPGSEDPGLDYRASRRSSRRRQMDPEERSRGNRRREVVTEESWPTSAASHSER